MIELNSLSFSYSSNGPQNTIVFEDFSDQCKANSITVIMGPSGCGKTTLLNLIAGILQPNSGSIVLSENKKKVGIVFQENSLIPWKTIQSNALFGATILGSNMKIAKEEAEYLLNEYELADYALEYPKTLSGGMQQRVAIIRAVASGAKVLLMDEPFSRLDYSLRKELQKDLLELVDRKGLTVVLVTHDINEAIRLGNEIIILTKCPSKVGARFRIDLSRTERYQENERYNGIMVSYINDLKIALSSGS